MTPLVELGILAGGIFFVLAAAFFVLRDLARVPVTEEGTAHVIDRGRMASAGVVLDESPLGRFNRSFDRFVMETGAPLDGFAVTGIVLTSAIIGAGIVFVLLNDEMQAIGGGAFFGLLPLTILAFVRRRRLNELGDRVPDALDTIARSMHAGSSIEDAVELAGRETPGFLGDELRQAARQLKLGAAAGSVMQSLGARVGTQDLRLLGAVLSMHRSAGGNLAATLERVAGVVRERQSYRRQMRSVTTAGRLSAQFIAASGPLLFLYLYNFERDHIQRLVESPLGWTLVATACVLEVIGLMWLMRILRSLRA
ncbi:MAG: type II secretion system F family protein [Planctomycetota bacterium]|jgi:tight adherence protein B